MTKAKDKTEAAPAAPETPAETYPPVNLTRLDPALKTVTVGVGWDLKNIESDDIDLDCSVFLLDRKDQTRVDEDFVFYNNPTGAGGAVQHTGDNRTGIGDGDDETVFINLQELPFDILKIQFVISIYNAYEREQNFTFVKNTFLRFVNQETGVQLYRLDLDDQLNDPHATAIVVGELYREGPNWIFQPTVEKVQHGLEEVARRTGIVVA